MAFKGGRILKFPFMYIIIDVFSYFASDAS